VFARPLRPNAFLDLISADNMICAVRRAAWTASLDLHQVSLNARADRVRHVDVVDEPIDDEAAVEPGEATVVGDLGRDFGPVRFGESVQRASGIDPLVTLRPATRRSLAFHLDTGFALRRGRRDDAIEP
jgi:hypothetical protein